MSKILNWHTKYDLSYSVRQLLINIYGNFELSKIDTYRLYFLDLGFGEYIRFIPLRKTNDLHIEINEKIPKSMAIKLLCLLKINGCFTTKKLQYIKV